jgi:peptide/histidine transporter 3/4
VQHKYPAKGGRNAFTYWENEIPTRIDYAKEKYGGPYSHENVETVKTFLRVVIVLVALIPYLAAIGDTFDDGVSLFITQFKNGY